VIEQSRTAAADAGRSERHQHLAAGAEFENLMSLAVLAPGVGDPEIAVAIDRRAVREHEHPRAPLRDQLAARVVFQDRRLTPARATNSRSSGG